MSPQWIAFHVHSQYSSSVSPFHANTDVPFAATAAAAWSCVEKMLHDAQRTFAPSACSVSISTAVCTVMCSDPVRRTPLNGCSGPYFSRTAISPGISYSARSSSLRPKSARVMSFTLYSCSILMLSSSSHKTTNNEKFRKKVRKQKKKKGRGKNKKEIMKI